MKLNQNAIGPVCDKVWNVLVDSTENTNRVEILATLEKNERIAAEEPESGDEQLEEEEEESEFDEEEYEDDEEEELRLGEHDDAQEYDDESSDFDDSDLLKRLDDKYGKIQHQQQNGNNGDDGGDIDPTWTSKAITG